MVRCNGSAGREKLNIRLGARRPVQALCAAASRPSCMQQRRAAEATQLSKVVMPLAPQWRWMAMSC